MKSILEAVRNHILSDGITLILPDTDQTLFDIYGNRFTENSFMTLWQEEVTQPEKILPCITYFLSSSASIGDKSVMKLMVDFWSWDSLMNSDGDKRVQKLLLDPYKYVDSLIPRIKIQDAIIGFITRENLQAGEDDFYYKELTMYQRHTEYNIHFVSL